MTVDEWRVRENTATQLGVVEESTSAMNESVENARILIVDDQEYDSIKFVETLQIDNDVVEVVTTGSDAMERVIAHDYDLMVISLNLMSEDGLRLCSHIRSSERSRSVPILMVAGDEDMSRIAHGLEMGAHDYIIRPVDKNELLARVRTQIRRKRFQERLRSTYEISLSMALMDSLTGLYNRRYFEVHLQKLLQKNETSRKSLGVLMIDIDKFKVVNDTHGHGVGDEILKEFALRLQDKLRGFDMVARLGGEEFVALLPDVSNDMAHIVAERLRKAICDKPFTCKVPDGSLDISTSIGGTIVMKGSVADPDEIMKQADDALYAAKDGGRNLTYFHETGKLNPDDFIAESRIFID